MCVWRQRQSQSKKKKERNCNYDHERLTNVKQQKGSDVPISFYMVLLFVLEMIFFVIKINSAFENVPSPSFSLLRSLSLVPILRASLWCLSVDSKMDIQCNTFNHIHFCAFISNLCVHIHFFGLCRLPLLYSVLECECVRRALFRTNETQNKLCVSFVHLYLMPFLGLCLSFLHLSIASHCG